MTKAKPTYQDFALNALGFSDEEDAAWLADRLTAHPADLVASRRVEEDLGALSLMAPEAEPPADLFDAIEAKLDAEAPEHTRTIRSEGGDWFERTEGVWCKILNDGADGVRTRLLRRPVSSWRHAANSNERP